MGSRYGARAGSGMLVLNADQAGSVPIGELHIRPVCVCAPEGGHTQRTHASLYRCLPCRCGPAVPADPRVSGQDASTLRWGRSRP